MEAVDTSIGTTAITGTEGSGREADRADRPALTQAWTWVGRWRRQAWMWRASTRTACTAHRTPRTRCTVPGGRAFTPVRREGTTPEGRLGREGSAHDHGARVGTRTGSSGVRTHLTMSAVGWVGVGRRNGFGRTPCPGGLSRVKSGPRHQGMGTRHVTVGNPRRPL